MASTAVLPPVVGPNTSGLGADIDLSNDDDEEMLEDKDEKPLLAPSKNIREDLSNLLQDGFEFDGTFAYSQKFDMGTAPNPCLNIQDLGPIGSPLSERDAQAIISRAKPYQSLTGVTLNNIWELNGQQVAFDNPLWDTWLHSTVVQQVRTALGVPVGSKMELDRLLLHQTGSEAVNYTDSTRGPAMFGTVQLVLPSRFTGAKLELSYAGQTKSLNLAHQSGLSTSIVGSYLGVAHQMASVESGYRLTLSYKLNQPLTEVLPALPEMAGVKHTLRDVLRSWKQNVDVDEEEYDDVDEDETPFALGCLLQHRYNTINNFSAKSLHGADELLLSHIRPAARELGFRVYLAHVSIERSGHVEIPERESYGCGYGRGYGGYGRYGRYYGDEEDDEEDEVNMDDLDMDEADDLEDSIIIGSVFDLDGMPSKILGLDLDIGDIVGGDYKDDEPDDKDLDEGQLTHTWKRTVLVIWPKARDLAVTVGDVFDYACNSLQSSLSISSSAKELKLVNSLIACCEGNKALLTDANLMKMKRAISVLRETADRWNDADTFLRAARACVVDVKMDLLGFEGFISAYQAFPWDALQGFYTDVIKNSASNVQRSELVDKLNEVAKDQHDTSVEKWCEEQRDSIARNLKPVNKDQIDWLVEIVKQRGFIFLRDVILPQIKAQPYDQIFWRQFIVKLSQAASSIPSSSEDLLRTLVSDFVLHLTQQAPAFPLANMSIYHTMGSADVTSIMDLMKLCVETNNVAFCDNVIKKMKLGAPAQSQHHRLKPVDYYLPLVVLMNSWLSSSPGIETSVAAVVQPFFRDAAEMIMDESVSLSPDVCPKLIVALRRSGGIPYLKQLMTAARIDALAKKKTLQSLTQALFSSMLPPPSDLASRKEFAVILRLCVKAIIKAFDFRSLSTRVTYLYTYSGAQSGADAAIALLKFCFDVGVGPATCGMVLNRLLTSVTVAADVQKHLTNVLVPFVPLLRTFMAQRNVELTAEPCASFCATVLKDFARSNLGPKPATPSVPPQLQDFKCNQYGCTDCPRIKAFFNSPPETFSIAAVQKVRTHLERQLQAAGCLGFGVKLETVRQGTPHTLRITKSASMTAHGAWLANSQKGKALLANLGDVNKQQSILGADYVWVQSTINGTGAPLQVTSTTNTGVGGPSIPASHGQKRPSDAALMLMASKKPRTL